MYALAMTINHHYWEQDHECHHTRQAEKEALESHSRKQEKASTSGPITASQNKTNFISSGLIHKELSLQVIFVPRSQKATQHSAGEPLFQAGQQQQVD